MHNVRPNTHGSHGHTEPDEYLHVAYLPQSAGWVLSVIKEVQSAKSTEMRALANSWVNSDLSELGLAVTTKLALLPHVIQSVDQLLALLVKEAAALDDLQEHIDREAGFKPQDQELPYKLLAAVDAFIYECRSTYEIVGKFLRRFSETFLAKPLNEQQVAVILRDAGLDDSWIPDLADQRKLFFHNTAPWVALKITNRSPFRAELLVLRRNVHDLTDTESVILFERLRAIHNGLGKSLTRLQQWLILRVRERDVALASD